MLAEAELVAFVATSDAERSRSFYEETLGLPLIELTPFACVFRAPNALLRVTVVPRPASAAYTVLGWRVPDIVAGVAWLRERGVQTLRPEGVEQDELGIWQSPGGARVVWFNDPDGNILSITQG